MKKILPYILIFVILVGLFSPMVKVGAADPVLGTCAISNLTEGGPVPEVNHKDPNPAPITFEECQAKKTRNNIVNWTENGKTKAEIVKEPVPKNTEGNSDFDNTVNDQLCVLIHWANGTMQGCILQIVYWTFYTLGGWLLAVAAYVFNYLIAITLSSTFLMAGFVPSAWATVRDFSNIFFIIVLLYLAIETILGFSHEAKKIIVRVIIMALLINFSMFFTKILIDTSNVLALVFYNKIKVQSPNSGSWKDVAGGLTNSFNPTTKLNADFFKSAADITVPGKPPTGSGVSVGTLIGITVIAGAIMLFAAYALFVSALSFLGRLVELFILIIFSPFAFMSWSVPFLSGTEYIGWDSWFKRLFSVSFMAPIFMFFLYFIFLLLDKPMFSGIGEGSNDLMLKLLGMIIPALVVLVLLLKATSFAKKGSGALGEVAISGAKLAAGLAVGGIALGGAAALRGTVGSVAKSVQNDSARGKALQLKSNLKDNFKTTASYINPMSYVRSMGTLGKYATAGVAQGIHAVGIGEKMKSLDKNLEEKSHSTHMLDAKAQQEYGDTHGKDVKYKDLIESEQEKVKKEIDKDEIAKKKYGDQFQKLGSPQKAEIMKDYDDGVRIIEDSAGVKTMAKVLDINHNAIAPVDAVTNNPIKDSKTGNDLKANEGKIRSDVIAEQSKVNSALGEFVQALRKGSYDIRNLPDMSAKSKGIFPKGAVGLAAMVAAGVRMGLKKGGGIEYGTPQKDAWKDVKNTITEALKNVKINVSSGGGGSHGGGHSGGDHGVKEVKSVAH